MRGSDTARLVGPREWVGTEGFPWPAAEALENGAGIVACYCVVSVNKDITKQGKPYYKLQLSDRHGAIEARVWEPVAEVMERIRQGEFVGVRASIETFNGTRQLKVSEIHPVEVGPEDLELFLARSPRDPAVMETELGELVSSVGDEGLRSLLGRLLDPASEIGRRFRRAPAAKHNHHAYVGGLLEHTLSITRAVSLMAEHYRPAVDRDLLVAGALLHDLGKIREIGTQAGFPYTDEGKLLGHILLGLQMVADAARDVPELGEARLLLLQHLIASHQGRYEWQSPREPRILEAIILHYCDDLDAKMNQAMSLLASVEAGWTGHDRAFGRELLRHHGTGPGAGADNGAGRRRKVRFAGKLAHGPEARGEVEPPPALPEGAGPPLEALPPRPVAPAPDVLAPDPHSLDLFEE